MCLSETHVTEGVFDSEIAISNYNIYRVNSDSRHTGGALIYINKRLRVLSCEKFCVQKKYWLVMLKFCFVGTNYIVVSLYRSPSSVCTDFLDFFESFVEDFLCDSNCGVIVTGDFNIDWLSDSGDRNRLKNCIADVGLMNVVTQITHPSNNSSGKEGSLIDLVLTNCEGVGTEISVTPRISTHFNIIVYMDGMSVTVDPLVVESRGRVVDFDSINRKLSMVRWDYRLSVDDRCRVLCSRLVSVLDEVAPKRVVKILPRYKSWWNQTVRSAVEDRDQSYRLYLLSRTDESREVYRRKRNMAVKIIRSERRRYYESQITENKHNSVKLWNIIKEILPKNDKRSDFMQIELDNGLIIDNKCDMPDALNHYYVDSVSEIISHIDKNGCNFPIIPKASNVRLQKFKPIDVDSLREIIFSMPNKGSSDEIDAVFLRNCFVSVAMPLLNIVNTSLETNIVPANLKISVVTPIPKVSNAGKAAELRPINMLSTVEKVLERVVYGQLIQFLEGNNLLSSVQSGFRERHSCETALQCVLDDWKRKKDNKLITGAVFLDLQRAFETVDRSLLVRKLEGFGVVDDALQWMISYLGDRRQKLKFNGILSDTVQSDLGVPQGSVLGPLLFLLYIDDITHVAGNCSIHLFADDILIYCAFDNVREVAVTINQTLEQVHKWCSYNSMKVNTKKTKFMIIGADRHYKSFNGGSMKVNLAGTDIEVVRKFRYLGVIVDYELSFKEHANHVIKTISFKINYLYRCSKYLNPWSLLLLYNSLVLPHFTYCATILYLLQQNEVSRLQKLQNRAMRIILACNRRTPVMHMLNCLQWLSVKNYILYLTMTFVYKIKAQLTPPYLIERICYNSEYHSYNTRTRTNFHIHHAISRSGQNSVFVKGLQAYNELPAELRGAASLKVFKNGMRRRLMEAQRG